MPSNQGRSRMAEVVPDEVQAAEGIRGFAHDPSRVGIFPEVGDDAPGLAAVGRDLLFTAACTPALSTSTTATLAPSRKASSRLSTCRPNRRRIFARCIAAR